MQDKIKNNSQFDVEIDLKELFDVLWAEKIKIIFITLLFAVFSIIYALSLPNQYKASLLLVPSQSSTGDFSSSMAQFGGLASMAGISIDNTEDSESRIAQEVMNSWNFIDNFISSNNLDVKIYAAHDWDKDSNKVLIDEDMYDDENQQWLIENAADLIGPPTSWTLYEKFSNMLDISEDNKSGLVTVSIEYFSPHLAKQWLDMYVTTINSYMQQKQVTKLQNNVEYLKNEIDKSSVSEMKNAFYDIMKEQIKKRMLAEANPEYVFVAVGPGMVPEEKSQPSRALICILITSLGGFLGVLFVLILHYTQRQD